MSSILKLNMHIQIFRICPVTRQGYGKKCKSSHLNSDLLKGNIYYRYIILVDPLRDGFLIFKTVNDKNKLSPS